MALMTATPEDTGYEPDRDWRCPATEGMNVDPGERGHRFEAIFCSDRRDGDWLFCQRCGRVVQATK